MSDDWEKSVEAAHDMVSALCRPRGSEGSREWIMSIPAREDHDPDLVITSGLMAAEKEIKSLRAQLAACAAGPWRDDVENAPKDGSEMIAEFEAHKGTRRLFAEWDAICDRWLTANGHYDHELLIAFAAINPPEPKP